MTKTHERSSHVFRLAVCIAAGVAFLLACWPLALRYARRITDQSDQPLGVLALVAAAWFIVRQWREASLRPMVVSLGAVVLVGAQLLPLRHAPLAIGVLAVVVLGFAIRLPRGRPGILALLVLSLPLMASLEFYAGYPLRLIAAELGLWLLRLCGLPVERAGVLLLDGGNLVGIDPPCAGIRMLWTAVFTAAVVAARARLSAARTTGLLTAAVVACVLGNAVRAAVVFFPESGRVHWPHGLHEGAGLLVHALVLGAVFALGSWLEDSASIRFARAARRVSEHGTWSAVVAGTALFGAMAFASFDLAGGDSPARPDGTVSWPATLDGVPLVPLPLEEHERRFAQGFPGSIGRFRCGRADVILRAVARATRQVHASSHCLRAAGFSIQEKPVFRDADHRLWGCSFAERGGQTWRVRERFVNAAQTRVCTDASAWFWEAVLHPDEGPWLAVTVMEEM